MTPDPLNFVLPDTFKGDTWDGFTWSISDVESNDSEYSATLTLARFQLQSESGTAALTLTSQTSGEVTINTASANAWSVTVEPRILNLDAGTYSYGLETTDADGVVKTRMAGILEIKADPVI